MEKNLFNISDFHKACGCTDSAATEVGFGCLVKNNSENGDCSDVLTMVFINEQPLNEIYSNEKAFQNGTLFPNLNKPFLGGAAK